VILQALHGYYRRKMLDPDPANRLPAAGLEDKEIPFVLELTPDGRLAGITDTRAQQGKKKVGKRFQVPQGVKRASGVAANLLWDTAEYVLGIDTKGKPERVSQQHAAFRRRIDELAARVPDAGLLAVQRFLAGTPLEAFQQQAQWAEVADINPLLTFRLADEVNLICQRPAVVVAAASAPVDEDNGCAAALACLVTGDTGAPQRLHSAIKGVWDAQTSGANIVSFNRDAFNSYAKSQGANAPVSSAAAFAYTTALNHLLSKGSRQRIQVGDASTVFWAQEAADGDIEAGFAALFGELDDPDARTAQVRALFEAIHSGRWDGAGSERRFYVLGLAPNAARLAVRFWHAAPLKDIAQRMRAWFDELELVRGPHDMEYPSLFRLLAAVAVQGKADNIPPRLGGDILRSILDGSPYPALWLNAAVQRCRAERQVSHLRAVGIKACLNRTLRTPINQEEIIKPMLDKQNPSVAYRLGRLFATLEKIQEEASPGLNATIRERYYGAASSTPTAVFTTLLRLKNHHLAKLGNRGRATNFEKLLGEIVGGIDDIPGHMALQDQGRFALGYYHQRQDFFTVHENAAGNGDTQNTKED
jgi:CRISPR-associated protein Cas8c/Csd1, subtype I-C/DVULG